MPNEKPPKIPVKEYLIKDIRHRGPMIGWDQWNHGVKTNFYTEDDLKNGDAFRIPIECPTEISEGRTCKAKLRDFPEAGPFFKRAFGKWPTACEVCLQIHIRLVARDK